MTLLQKLQEDMKAAMKSGDKQRLSVIRMLISDVKNIDLQPQKTTEEQAVAAYAKKLRKSADEFERLGRAEQAAQLREELTITESYLPKKASPEETERMVDEFLARHTFAENQVGQAMGAFMKEHGDQVEGSLVNPLLRRKLAGK